MPQNHSLFRSISCFGNIKITAPIWLQKIMKMCEQILKKTAPEYNSNSLNCKKTKRRPIIVPAIAVRLLNKNDLAENTNKQINTTHSLEKSYNETNINFDIVSRLMDEKFYHFPLCKMPSRRSAWFDVSFVLDKLFQDTGCQKWASNKDLKEPLPMLWNAAKRNIVDCRI